MKGGGALAALWLTGAAHAADDVARWYVRIDNDVVFHTDRWYTSAARLARVKDGWEFGLEQDIYTPEAKRIELADRAPTARLLGSAARHFAGDDFLQTLEADLGVRGPSALGEQVTRSIHSVVVSAPHVDWSRQLPDRFDASAIFSRTQALGSFPLRAHFGAVLGTQVSFAHAGLEARAGEPRAPSSAMLRFAASPPFADGVRGWSAYLGASARAVGRDALLGPDYYVAGAPITPRHEVTRVAAGFAWLAAWGSATFDLVRDSREFAEQRTSDRFGSLALHFAF